MPIVFVNSTCFLNSAPKLDSLCPHCVARSLEIFLSRSNNHTRTELEFGRWCRYKEWIVHVWSTIHTSTESEHRLSLFGVTIPPGLISSTDSVVAMVSADGVATTSRPGFFLFAFAGILENWLFVVCFLFWFCSNLWELRHTISLLPEWVQRLAW
jgi:hypothetical protein